MVKVITLREAKQALARYVRRAEAGEDYVITRKGTPVARLVRAGISHPSIAARNAALARTRTRMAQGWPIGAERLDRAVLHDRC